MSFKVEMKAPQHNQVLSNLSSCVSKQVEGSKESCFDAVN